MYNYMRGALCEWVSFLLKRQSFKSYNIVVSQIREEGPETTNLYFKQVQSTIKGLPSFVKNESQFYSAFCCNEIQIN